MERPISILMSVRRTVWSPVRRSSSTSLEATPWVVLEISEGERLVDLLG